MSSADAGVAVSREACLTQAFVELADSLTSDFDVIDFLTVLSQRCVELLGVSAAGILLTDQHANLRVTASSSEQAELLELFELQNDEGPCLDCYRSGEPVSNQDLTSSDGPWPRFATAALSIGFHSVHALPMRLRETVIGSLNLFGTDPGSLATADMLVAQGLADVATISLLQHRAARGARLLTDHLSVALDSRVIIEQAKGVLAERCDITMEEAFSRLRLTARNSNQRLGLVANDVVNGTLLADELPAGTAPTG